MILDDPTILIYRNIIKNNSNSSPPKSVTRAQGCGICGNRGTWFPGTFFLPGTFLRISLKESGKLCFTAQEVPGKVWKLITHFLSGTFYEKLKSAWKSKEVKDLFLPGNCSIVMKRCLGKCRSKGHFLPGTFYEQMKSAWKSTEVKDLIWEPHFTKKCVYLGIA